MTNDDAGSGARTAANRHVRQEGCLDRPRDPLPTRVDLCPPLPRAYDDALDAALDGLGIAIAPRVRSAIEGHVRLLLAWNQAINLSAVRDPAVIAVRHVADSLTGLPLLAGRGIDRFVDLGSGGGFPGLTLAAALPADRALLVDSIAKKVRFLATTAAATGLADHVAAISARAEDLVTRGGDREAWPAVTARAVARLPDLIELALPFLRPGGILVAWKRGPAGDPDGLAGELAEGATALRAIDPGARIEVVPAAPALRQRLKPEATERHAPGDIADHVLVVVERGHGSLDPRWPRDPAARRRHPWTATARAAGRC